MKIMVAHWPSMSSASLVAGQVHVGQMNQTLGLGLLLLEDSPEMLQVKTRKALLFVEGKI